MDTWVSITDFYYTPLGKLPFAWLPFEQPGPRGTQVRVVQGKASICGHPLVHYNGDIVAVLRCDFLQTKNKI